MLLKPYFFFFLFRYSVRLDPDPCRSTAIILICIIEILMNSDTSELKSRYCSLIPSFCFPASFSLSICVVKIYATQMCTCSAYMGFMYEFMNLCG